MSGKLAVAPLVLGFVLAVVAAAIAQDRELWRERALRTCRIKIIVPLDGPTHLEAFPVPQNVEWCPDGDPLADVDTVAVAPPPKT